MCQIDFQRKESKAIKRIIFLNIVFFASGKILRKLIKYWEIFKSTYNINFMLSEVLSQLPL